VEFVSRISAIIDFPDVDALVSSMEQDDTDTSALVDLPPSS
jgi:FAD synthase